MKLNKGILLTAASLLALGMTCAAQAYCWNVVNQYGRVIQHCVPGPYPYGPYWHGPACPGPYCHPGYGPGPYHPWYGPCPGPYCHGRYYGPCPGPYCHPYGPGPGPYYHPGYGPGPGPYGHCWINANGVRVCN